MGSFAIIILMDTMFPFEHPRIEENVLLGLRELKPHTLFLNIITQYKHKAEVILDTIEKE